MLLLEKQRKLSVGRHFPDFSYPSCSILLGEGFRADESPAGADGTGRTRRAPSV